MGVCPRAPVIRGYLVVASLLAAAPPHLASAVPLGEGCAAVPKSPLVVNIKDRGAKGDGKTWTALGTDGTMASITDSLGRLRFAPATSTYAYDILQGKADGYTLTATTTDPLASLTVNGEPAQSGRPAGSETPKEAEVVSHQLMMRAGMIKRPRCSPKSRVIPGCMQDTDEGTNPKPSGRTSAISSRIHA